MARRRSNRKQQTPSNVRSGETQTEGEPTDNQGELPPRHQKNRRRRNKRLPLHKKRYLYVCILLVITIAVIPMTVDVEGEIEGIAALYIYTIALLTAVWAAHGKPGHLFVVGVLAVCALFMEHLHELAGLPRQSFWFVPTVALWIIVTIRCLFIIAKDLAVQTLIRTNEVLGAVSLYLFLGILWTLFYVACNTYNPDAFFLDPARYEGKSVASDGDLLFFSFSTLTTLGYGDITPMSAIVRSLAVIESIVGVLFLATLIARFVSLDSRIDL